MWIIFNPTNQDFNYDIDYKKWPLKAGETKKFPNHIGQQMYNLHGFLQILKKDDDQPQQPVYSPPTDLDSVEEAGAVDIHRDRALKHPTSEPGVRENAGFNSRPRIKDDFSDEASGLPKTYQKKLEEGKLMSFDKDGVGWYGDGMTTDNPMSKE